MINITIEHNGKKRTIETDYVMLLTGKKDGVKLGGSPTVINLTIDELLKNNALWGHIIMKELNKRS